MADKAYAACKAALEALKIIDPTLQFRDWEDTDGRKVEKKLAAAAAKCKAVVEKGQPLGQSLN